MDLAFKALSDARRREILKLIWTDELASSTIASHFPEVSRPAISQHLGVLRHAGLVTERRSGTRRLYCANHTEVRKLQRFLEEFWTSSLENLRRLAEEIPAHQPQEHTRSK